MKHFIIAPLLLASFSSYAVTRQVTGSASFEATGTPGFVHVNGEGAHVKGTAEERDGVVTGAFIVVLSELTTGVGLRDKHMHEKYLQDEHWPEARLVLEPWKSSPVATPFQGKLTLKGVTKLVSGKASVSKNNTLHAEFDLTLDDYGVGVPSWAGVTVAKTVHVTVEAEVQ